LGIEIIGTVGVILEANAAGLIELSTELVDRLEKANFRISVALRSRLLDSKPRIR
jgi:predicted nucleic acid-binding protein